MNDVTSTIKTLRQLLFITINTFAKNNKMAYHAILSTFPNKTFRLSPLFVGFLVIFLFMNVCCANSSSSSDDDGADDHERYQNHIQYQKQKTPKNYPRYHSRHSDRQRNRRNDGSFHHRNVDAETTFNSIDRFYDLSHAYFDGMPVEEGAVPLELSLMKQDGGEGARYDIKK